MIFVWEKCVKQALCLIPVGWKVTVRELKSKTNRGPPGPPEKEGSMVGSGAGISTFEVDPKTLEVGSFTIFKGSFTIF